MAPITIADTPNAVPLQRSHQILSLSCIAGYLTPLMRRYPAIIQARSTLETVKRNSPTVTSVRCLLSAVSGKIL